MAVEIFMPKMSDHMEEGEIIRWLVKEGDQIEQGQVIMELMTDKAVAELEAPASGVLKGIRVGAEDGKIVPVGETFAFVAKPDEEVPKLPPLGAAGAPTEAAAPTTDTAEPAAPASPPMEAGKVRATPVARRQARELGIDLAQVTGTGPGGRIKEEDVRAFAEAAKPTAAPEPEAIRAVPAARRLARELGVDLNQVTGTGPGGRIKPQDIQSYADTAGAAPELAAEGDLLELSSIQRLTGQRMLESIHTAPHFTLTTEVDMTQTLWLREALMERVEAETGARLSVTAILTKIVGLALKTHPRANASFEDGKVRLHPQVNVGVAVGTDDGLVVPTIKETDQKDLVEITRELKAFQEKAKTMRFTSDELAGGTFTISNLGMYGVDSFNAIINPPQSAILAVGRIVKKPAGLEDGNIGLLPMMTLTLSVDHRSLDGLQGAKFLAEIKQSLEKPFSLL